LGVSSDWIMAVSMVRLSSASGFRGIRDTGADA
jgi:hypothetical protein